MLDDINDETRKLDATTDVDAAVLRYYWHARASKVSVTGPSTYKERLPLQQYSSAVD